LWTDNINLWIGEAFILLGSDDVLKMTKGRVQWQKGSPCADQPKNKIIICDKNGVYRFYFVRTSYLTSQQRVKYDVHTMSIMKHTRHFLSHIIFIANLSAIFIGTIL